MESQDITKYEVWANDVDIFCDNLTKAIRESSYTAEVIADVSTPPPPIYPELPRAKSGYYVRCQRDGHDAFYSWFAPASDKGKPLMVVSPGYEATLRRMPELTDKFNVLFVSPLGYCNPAGQVNEKRRRGAWPVLFDTVFGGKDGYDQWLLDAMTAIRWVRENTASDTSKLIFVGTSQGGGMSLILGSIYRENTIAVFADQPFLVDFSGTRINDVIDFCSYDPYMIIKSSEVQRRLSCVDPMKHAHRLTMPVYLVSGEIDKQCPACYTEELFKVLPGAKNHTVMLGRDHGYNIQFYHYMKALL